jgi:hypothetical protein
MVIRPRRLDGAGAIGRQGVATRSIQNAAGPSREREPGHEATDGLGTARETAIAGEPDTERAVERQERMEQVLLGPQVVLVDDPYAGYS